MKYKNLIIILIILVLVYFTFNYFKEKNVVGEDLSNLEPQGESYDINNLQPDLTFQNDQVYPIDDVTLTFNSDNTGFYNYLDELINLGENDGVYLDKNDLGKEIGVKGLVDLNFGSILIRPLTKDTYYKFNSFYGELNNLELINGEIQVLVNNKEILNILDDKIQFNKENFNLIDFADVSLILKSGESYIGLGNEGVFLNDPLDKESEFITNPSFITGALVFNSEDEKDFVLDIENAEHYQEIKNYDKAIEIYNNLLLKYTQNSAIYSNVFNNLENSEDPAQTIINKIEEMKFRKDSDLAESLTEQEKYDDAIKIYQDLLSRTNNEEIKSLINYYIGYNYLLKQDLTNAQLSFNQINKESRVNLYSKNILKEFYSNLLSEEALRIENEYNKIKDRRESSGFGTSITNFFNKLFNKQGYEQEQNSIDQVYYGTTCGLKYLASNIYSYDTIFQALDQVTELGYCKSYAKQNPLVNSLLEMENLGDSLTEEDLFKINLERANSYYELEDYNGATKSYLGIINDYRNTKTEYGSYYELNNGEPSLFLIKGDSIYDERLSFENQHPLAEDLLNPETTGIEDYNNIIEEISRLNKIDSVNNYHNYYQEAQSGLTKTGFNNLASNAIILVNDEFLSAQGIAEGYLFAKTISLGGKLFFYSISLAENPLIVKTFLKESYTKFFKTSGEEILETEIGSNSLLPVSISKNERLLDKTQILSLSEKELANLGYKKINYKGETSLVWNELPTSFRPEYAYESDRKIFKVGDKVFVSVNNKDLVGKISGIVGDSKRLDYIVKIYSDDGVVLGEVPFTIEELISTNEVISKKTDLLKNVVKSSRQNKANSDLIKKYKIAQYYGHPPYPMLERIFETLKYKYISDPTNDKIYGDLLNDYRNIQGQYGYSIKTINLITRDLSQRLGGSVSLEEWHCWSEFYSDSFESANRVLYFGEIIKQGKGVCRHRSIILNDVLQRLGFDSKAVVGKVEFSDLPHAWVVVETPYGKLVVEPSSSPEVLLESILELNKNGKYKNYLPTEGGYLWQEKR